MEHTTKRPLVLSTPPHVFDGITTQKVMLNVVIALVPTLIASFVIFGWRALLVTAVTTAACVLFARPPRRQATCPPWSRACCWPSTYPPPSRCTWR